MISSEFCEFSKIIGNLCFFLLDFKKTVDNTKEKLKYSTG